MHQELEAERNSSVLPNALLQSAVWKVGLVLARTYDTMHITMYVCNVKRDASYCVRSG